MQALTSHGVFATVWWLAVGLSLTTILVLLVMSCCARRRSKRRYQLRRKAVVGFAVATFVFGATFPYLMVATSS
jgi:heme exporter protein D